MKKRILTVLLLLCAILLCFAACDNKDPTEAELRALKIAQAPAKTAYTAGESFDKTGMIVMAVYSDGSETEITAYTVDKTTLTEDDTAVTVSYKGLSAAQTVTVSAAAPVSSGDESPSTETPSTEFATTDPSASEYDSVSLVNAPIRETYVAGEIFDPTGILLRCTKGAEETLTSACTFPDTALTEDTTAVTVSCGGLTVDVPVTVAAGSPMTWGEPSYAQETVDALINELKNVAATQSDIDIGLVYNGQVLNKLLPHSYAAGVSSFAELLAELDYHLFYGCSSMVIKVNYDYGDLEETLDRLYFESGFVGGCMSIKGQALADGYVQIIVKYYSNTLMSVTPTALIPSYLDFTHTDSTRAADYQFAKIDAANGIAVYNSEQAIWALSHGYSIAPVAGSPVETVLARAKQILISCCDDTMSSYQKMYNVYYYIQTHVTYDFTGEEWAARSPDPANESDMLSSMLVSFRAEGPLLYGNAACYGYAKAITLLLGLEGFDITRVVGKYYNIVGRSQNEYDSYNGEYMESIGTHSYSYVRIDGYDYLIDGTYAIAGIPFVQDHECTVYRDFCVGCSKERHAQVYTRLQDDSYCSAPDYNPANFDNELLASYDGGAHDCLLESEEEVSAYLAALADQVTERNSYYAFYVTVSADVYFDEFAFRDAATAQLEAAFGSCYYWRYARVRDVNGMDCYTMTGVVYPA